MGIEAETLASKNTADTDAILNDWRARAVRIVLAVVAVSGLLSWGSVLNNDRLLNRITPITWGYVAIYLAFVLLALLPRIDYRLRSWGLILLIYANAVASFARLGLVGSGRLYLLSAPIFATLLLGSRAGILTTVLSLAVYFTIAPLASFNQFGEWHRLLENPYLLDRWGEAGMALVTFLFTVMVMVVSFQHLMRRTLAARQEASRALEKTARALQEREERLALVMQATNDGLFDWDVLSGSVYYSPRWKSMLGYSDHEVEGTLAGWRKLLHPDDHERALAAVQAHLEGRTPYLELEHRLKHKDGEYRWILARGLALRDPTGKAYRVVGSHTDNTARRQAEEALQEREAKYRSIVEMTAEWIWEIDAQGLHTFSNPAVQTILGYSPEELVGQDCYPLMHPEDRPAIRDALDGFIPSRQGWRNWVFRWQHRDGSYRYLESNATPIFDPDGELRGYVGSDRDITARKQAEEEIRRKNDLLAALHETALGVIRQMDLAGLLETLAERAVSLVGADSGFIFLVTPEKDAIETKVGIGLDRKHVGDRLKPGEGLSGTIWQTGEPLVMEDYQSWPQRSPLYEQESIGPAMGAPLKSAAEVVGVLGVTRPAGSQAFQQDEVGTLNRFAQLASIALENARLHTSLQEELDERKRAEEAVRASDVEMRALLAAMTDVILVLDADGRYIKIAPTNPALLYQPASEMIGKTLREVFPPEQADAFITNIQQALAAQQPVNFEYQLTIGEREIWFDATVSPMSDCSVIWVARDITPRKLAQRSLQQRLDFEQLITNISTEFINLGPTEIDAGIQHALQAIGEFAGADRSYVFQFSEDQACMDNSHEWCAPGIEPQSQRLQRQTTQVTPWTSERIRRLEAVKVPKVADLAGEAPLDQMEFEAQSIQSLICIPMVYQGEAIGFIGFDAVKHERAWSEDDAALLRVVGEIIVNSLEHKRAQAIQDGQRKFLELLATGGGFSEILHALVRLIEEQWPGMSGLVLLLDEDGQHLHIGASASLPEEYVASIEGLEIGPQVGSCGTACYTKQRVIVEDILTDPRWEGLRSLGLKYGLRACWSEPVFSAAGQVVGTFAMYYRQPRTPTKAELRTIETAAHLVGVAIEHENAEQALQQTELRFRGVFEGAPIGVSITGLDGRLVETNRALQQMFGYSEAELRDLSVFDYTYPEDVAEDTRLFYDELVPGKRDHYQLEKRYIRKNGELFWGRLSLSLARSPQGEPLFAIATTEDITAAKEAADQLAQAYQSLELRVVERTRELAAVNAIAAAVSRSLDLNAILSDALAKTLEVTGMELGIAYQLEAPEPGVPGSGRLIPLTHLGFSDRFFPISTALNVEASNVERASATGVPVVWDPQAYPNPVIRRAIEAEGVRSGISIPLLAKDRLVGALIIASRQAHPFAPEEKSMLAAIGQQVALAVENARLYDQVQQTALLAERSRLARELHDSVTQSLYSVTLYAEAAARLFTTGDSQTAAGYLRELRDTAQEALREMRLLIYELRPPVLGTSGLAGALQARLDAVEARAGLETRLEVEGTDRLPYAVQEELYHIAREALNNLLKHAKAHRVRINLSFRDTLARLEICDDGIGFDLAEIRAHGGLGIAGMRERAQRIGAHLEIDSALGRGTTVRVLAGSSPENK